MAASEQHEFLHAFQACVNLLTRDCRRALSGMFDLTAPRLVRFAMTITGNQSDAEDALQSAFSRIATKPGQLAAAETPWPYLIRTVRNECLRLLQKKKRMVNDDFSAMAASAGNAQTTVENLAVYEETSEQIRRILRSLPQSQYEVVILKHWEDLTFAEIAEALELPQNTVASRYRYAMEKLQRSLEYLTR